MAVEYLATLDDTDLDESYGTSRAVACWELRDFLDWLKLRKPLAMAQETALRVRLFCAAQGEYGPVDDGLARLMREAADALLPPEEQR